MVEVYTIREIKITSGWSQIGKVYTVIDVRGERVEYFDHERNTNHVSSIEGIRKNFELIK